MTLLRFFCGECGAGENILIDNDSSSDLMKLSEWIKTHDARGGRYETVTMIACPNCKGTGKVIEVSK